MSVQSALARDGDRAPACAARLAEMALGEFLAHLFGLSIV
jgi:hypothetical protein